MTRGLSTLSRDVMLYLFEFNEYDDNLHLITCCREWYELYMKKEVRRVTVRRWRNDLISGIREVIENPLKQLSIKRGTLSLEFATVIHHQLYELECAGKDFVTTMNHVGTFRVKNLIINGLQGECDRRYEPVVEALARIADCQSLTLIFTISVSSSDTNIPYVSSVRHLSIKRSGDVFRSMFAYSNTLHQLCLFRCDISDVSMLGSIPHLELRHCNEVKDLSALNNNDTIVVNTCRKLRNYSNCFANSRKIEVCVGSEGTYNIDLAGWTKVEDLTLSDWSNGKASYKLSPHRWSRIKRFDLHGIFVSRIDFSGTSNHLLHELKLSYDTTITSLEGYGLERVASIECCDLISLQSLEGLGRGRNRKIIISYCHQITDFSPLLHVPIVEIEYCEGFTDPPQVGGVQDLTIWSDEPLSFTSYAIYNYQYGSNITNFLTVNNLRELKVFNGLEKIPHLQLGTHHLSLLYDYLSQGNCLENQRIIIMGVNTEHYSSLWSIHQQFLQSHYDYDYNNDKRERWIWFRKVH